MSYGILVLVYLFLAIASVAVLSRLLRRHGHVFLQELFPGKPEPATALMALLDIGFYLVSLGYIALRIGSGPRAEALPLPEAVSTIAEYLGTQFLLIGALHLFNMAAFSKKMRLRDSSPVTGQETSSP